MFGGEIKWIGPFFRGRDGKFCRIVTFKLFEASRSSGKVYLVLGNRNYSRWEPLLTEGLVIKNLIWKDEERGLVDADSPVEEV